MDNDTSHGVKDTEAGSILGLHPQTLRNKRSKGEGPPYYKIGRAVRYVKADLIAYREARKVQTKG